MLAEIEKTIGLEAVANTNGDVIFNYRGSVEHNDDFMNHLLDKVEATQGVKLAVIKDQGTSQADWVRMVSRFSKRFASLSAEGKMVEQPTVDQTGSLEAYVTKRAEVRKIEKGQVVQILSTDNRVTVGGVPLAQQFEIVVVGSKRALSNVRTLTFEQIVAAILSAEKATSTSA